MAEHTGGGRRRGAAQQIDTDHLGGDRAEAQQTEGRQRAAVGEQGQSREVQREEQRRGGERDSPGGAPPAAELQPRAREREHDQGEQQTAALEAPGQEGADDEDRVGIKAREAREGILDCLEAERQHRSCPLYQQACRTLLPNDAYPLPRQSGLLPGLVIPAGVELPCFSMN